MKSPALNAVRIMASAVKCVVLAAGLMVPLAAWSAEEEVPSVAGLELTNPADILLVVRCNSHATKAGVTAAALRTVIEPQLTVAGIRFTNIASMTQLVVDANSDSSRTNCNLSFSFRRPVKFEAGGRTFRSEATTWNGSMMVSFSERTNFALPAAELLTREFVTEHKKANPLIALRGKVVANDPKYQFVIVDIGKQAGVKDGQELSVERNGQVVAVLKVVSVNPDHSICNVLQAPAPQEVFEGDSVVPRR